MIMKIKKLNEMATSKKKIAKFLEELTIITKKYNIYLDTTDDMFLSDDNGDIGSIKYDYESDKYVVSDKLPLIDWMNKHRD